MNPFDQAWALLKLEVGACSHCGALLNSQNHTLDDGVDFPRMLCDDCYKKHFYYFNEDLMNDPEVDTWWSDNQ